MSLHTWMIWLSGIRFQCGTELGKAELPGSEMQANRHWPEEAQRDPKRINLAARHAAPMPAQKKARQAPGFLFDEYGQLTFAARPAWPAYRLGSDEGWGWHCPARGSSGFHWDCLAGLT